MLQTEIVKSKLLFQNVLILRNPGLADFGDITIIGVSRSQGLPYLTYMYFGSSLGKM